MILVQYTSWSYFRVVRALRVAGHSSPSCVARLASLWTRFGNFLFYTSFWTAGTSLDLQPFSFLFQSNFSVYDTAPIGSMSSNIMVQVFYNAWKTFFHCHSSSFPIFHSFLFVLRNFPHDFYSSYNFEFHTTRRNMDDDLSFPVACYIYDLLRASRLLTDYYNIFSDDFSTTDDVHCVRL